MTDAKQPLISIIIPSLNQGAYIEKTILSALRQNYPSIEVIVADGGSTDQTLEVLRKYPEVTWFSEPDRGYADAVNKGLARATGEIVGIQSSDDFYAPGAFRAAAQAFKEDPGIALVAGSRATYEPSLDKTVLSFAPGPLDFRRLLEARTWVYQDSAFARRQALDSIGRLNEHADYVADLDLWARLLHKHRATIVPKVMSIYTRHHDQRTQSAALRFVDDYTRCIKSLADLGTSSCEAPTSTEWFEACLTARQAFWLLRGGMTEKAAQRLKDGFAVYPRMRSWPISRYLARGTGLDKIPPWQIPTDEWVERIRSYRARSTAQRLHEHLPDPRWMWLEARVAA